MWAHGNWRLILKIQMDTIQDNEVKRPILTIRVAIVEAGYRYVNAIIGFIIASMNERLATLGVKATLFSILLIFTYELIVLSDFNVHCP